MNAAAAEGIRDAKGHGSDKKGGSGKSEEELPGSHKNMAKYFREEEAKANTSGNKDLAKAYGHAADVHEAYAANPEKLHEDLSALSKKWGGRSETVEAEGRDKDAKQDHTLAEYEEYLYGLCKNIHDTEEQLSDMKITKRQFQEKIFQLRQAITIRVEVAPS